MRLFSGDLKLVSGKKFTLVGTPQGHEIKDPNGICALVVRRFDVDMNP